MLHPILLISLLLCCPRQANALPWSRRGRVDQDRKTDDASARKAGNASARKAGDGGRRRLVDETIGRRLPVDEGPSDRSHDEAAVSAGHHFTCSLASRSGITRGGTVRCFGHNQQGQTDAPSGIFQQVTSGASHGCAVAATGAVSCWGNIPPPPEYKSFVQLSSGGDHVCGIQSIGGNILCWGSNHHGESDPPASAGPFVQVSSGQSYSCGLHRDGKAVCWGKDHQGQTRPPDGVTFRQISAGFDHHVCGITAEEGNIRCWGHNSRGQAEDRDDGPYRQVSAGRRAACAIREDTLGIVCWGGSSPIPAEDMTSRRYKQISLGRDHACAVDVDKRLHCWQNGADLGAHNVPVGFQVGGEL